MELPDYRRKIIIPVVNTGMGGGAFQFVCYGLDSETIHRGDVHREVVARLRKRGFGEEWKPVWDAIHVEASEYKRLGFLGKRPVRYYS